MKLLVTAGKQIQKAAAAVVKAVAGEEEPPAPLDPWRRNERPAELTRGGRWLNRRRRGWLR
jgi:hypothetical protein